MSNERLAISHADVDDLDLPRLFAFVAERLPVIVATSTREEAAIRLGLLARTMPRVVPTTTGLYLFGKLPQTYFPEWGVTCMASAGTMLLDDVRARADLDGGLP